MSDNPKPAQKFFTPIERRIEEDKKEVEARQEELNKQYTKEEFAGADAALPSVFRNDATNEAAAKQKNFDQKIYLFPESFNALRRELEENYPTFFFDPNPEFQGKSAGWCMVYDAPTFVAMCNGALDMLVQFDTNNVDGICKQFLDGFRKLRGVSALH